MSSSLPLPNKTLNFDLEFRDKPYDVSRQDISEKFRKDSSRVRAYINEHLSNFAGLGTLVQLNLDGGQSHAGSSIFIDARSSQVKVLDSARADVEPAIVANIGPEFVLDVIEGRMHAQHAFGKRARPPCPGAFASCFSPMGPSKPVLSVENGLDTSILPKPTEHIDQIKHDLRKWGYAFVGNALSPAQVDILRTAVEEQAAGELKAGIAHIDASHKHAGDQPNQRVWNLPNKGDEFLDLLNHPIVDAIMPWFLGDSFTVHTMSANIARPGKSGIYMHRDQMGLTPETIDHAYLLNALWYLVDVTDERGATRVFPGSHDKNVAPTSLNDIGGSVPAAAPAGTLLLLDSRTWHSTGVNTTNLTRPVILQAFCRFFVKQMENYQVLLSEETKGKLSDRQRALLGFPVQNGAQAYTAYSKPGEGAGRQRAPVTNEVLKAI